MQALFLSEAEKNRALPIDDRLLVRMNAATAGFEFVYDGDATQANVFSADDGADVGLDEGTAVASAYSIPFKFTGEIHKVTIDVNL